MNGGDDLDLLQRTSGAQRGVYSTADLRVLFAERHRAAFTRRVTALVEAGTLRRFTRGMYVHGDFDPWTLSQRLAPDSYVSFGPVLARHLVIGSKPAHQVLAAKTGRAQTYAALGLEIVHVHIAEHLDFGHTTEDGVKIADAEKALLDTLYYHLRGRRYPFDIYSDLDVSGLDRAKLDRYLGRYRNPRFVSFVMRVVGEA